jgi:hypothetical protein
MIQLLGLVLISFLLTSFLLVPFIILGTPVNFIFYFLQSVFLGS